jgi:FtsZ-interacting cell division protein ZipA
MAYYGWGHASDIREQRKQRRGEMVQGSIAGIAAMLQGLGQWKQRSDQMDMEKQRLKSDQDWKERQAKAEEDRHREDLAERENERLRREREDSATQERWNKDRSAKFDEGEADRASKERLAREERSAKNIQTYAERQAKERTAKEQRDYRRPLDHQAQQRGGRSGGHRDPAGEDDNGGPHRQRAGRAAWVGPGQDQDGHRIPHR